MTPYVYAAVLTILVALGAAAVELRDRNRALHLDNERLAEELDAAYARLGDALDDLALMPAPLFLVPDQPPIHLVPLSDQEWEDLRAEIGWDER